MSAMVPYTRLKDEIFAIDNCMNPHVLDADVNKLCIRVMKKLIEKTQNNETISIDRNTIFEEVHTASTGIDAFNTDSITLKKRVFQELFARGHIKENNNSEEIKITSIAKEYPEYTNT
jgi:hypothetical protein